MFANNNLILRIVLCFQSTTSSSSIVFEDGNGFPQRESIRMNQIRRAAEDSNEQSTMSQEYELRPLKAHTTDGIYSAESTSTATPERRQSTKRLVRQPSVPTDSKGAIIITPWW